MHRYINNLRNKSETSRKQIALGVSSIVMIGIVTIWIVTFSVRFPGMSLQSTTVYQSPENSTAAVNNASAIETLRQQINADPNGVMQQYQNESTDSNGISISNVGQGYGQNTEN